MKNKKMMIAALIAVSLLIIGGVLLFGKFFEKEKEEKITDAIKFQQEYTMVDKDNLFVYRSADEIISILENGTGVVYLGFPECPWCQAYVPYLDEVAKNLGVEKIYYYNIYQDRKDNTENYKKMVELIGDSLPFDEEGNRRIYAPSIICLDKGKVVGFDDETAWDTKGFEDPADYWTKDEVKDLKEKLTDIIQKTLKNVCSDCNK